jgi:glycosyltransferase involved in cell wall biosynthesis
MLIGIDASRANREQRTGVENYAWNIIQELKKIVPEEIQVVLYSETLLKDDLAELPKNWQSKVLLWQPKRFWTQARLSWEMFTNPPDVLFIPAHVFPLIHPRKTVMMIHDIAAIKFPESYNWFERWYALFSAKMALRKLWKVIVPSEFVKSELEKLEIGPPWRRKLEIGRKICVIKHGVDEKFKKIDNETDIRQILDKYCLNKPFIMSIGRLEEKKNTFRIIESFDILKQLKNFQFPPPWRTNFQLLLVGKPGFGYEKVAEAIQKSPYKQDIVVPGFVLEDDLPYLLNAATVFVFPSLYEGFGLPVLEAMACGAPVVASKNNCLEEVCGDAALYVDAENIDEIAGSIKELLCNEVLKQEKIYKGLARVQIFNWEKTAKETFFQLTKPLN